MAGTGHGGCGGGGDLLQILEVYLALRLPLEDYPLVLFSSNAKSF